MADDEERYSVGDLIKGTLRFIFISQKRYNEIVEELPIQEGYGDVWEKLLKEAQDERLKRREAKQEQERKDASQRSIEGYYEE